MKLPLLEHLKVRKFPQQLPRFHNSTFHVSQEQEPTEDILKANHYHRTTVEIGYTSIDSDETPTRYIRERGTKFIMREVYSPIVDELIILAKELTEAGFSSHDKPMKHLYEMIDTLEGNK